MPSKKTIKLDTDDLTSNTITFTFYIVVIHINIHINNINNTRIISHTEFNQTLSELKTDYIINDHTIHLIQKWYDKNYKKLHPNTEYVTKYGRLTKRIN